MIRLQRIRVKGVKMELPGRTHLDGLRKLLAKHFGTNDILFEYEDDGKGGLK